MNGIFYVKINFFSNIHLQIYEMNRDQGVTTEGLQAIAKGLKTLKILNDISLDFHR